MYALDMDEEEAEEYLDELLEETNTERTGSGEVTGRRAAQIARRGAGVRHRRGGR